MPIHDPSRDFTRIGDRSLWVGASPWDGPAFLAHPARFSMLVLCADDAQEPPEGVEPTVKVVRVPLRDTDAPEGSLSDREAAGAVWAAEQVANELRAGGRVAVGCLAGVNRSAFVAALALVRVGLSPEQAIAEVRRWRGPAVASGGYRVLRNEDFLAFLRGLMPVAEARP